MGIRKTIYIPDEETWVGIQEAAKAEGRSVSNYLVQLHRNNLDYKDAIKTAESALDRAEKNRDEYHQSGVDAIVDKKVIEVPESKSLKRRVEVQTRKPVTDQFGRIIDGSYSKESQVGKKKGNK